jgi:hypothetical protein
MKLYPCEFVEYSCNAFSQFAFGFQSSRFQPIHIHSRTYRIPERVHGFHCSLQASLTDGILYSSLFSTVSKVVLTRSEQVYQPTSQTAQNSRSAGFQPSFVIHRGGPFAQALISSLILTFTLRNCLLNPSVETPFSLESRPPW